MYFTHCNFNFCRYISVGTYIFSPTICLSYSWL